MHPNKLWDKINDWCSNINDHLHTVYPKKYAPGFCFAVLCCGYTLTDFPISIRLTSLALWQSNDCPSAGKATLMNMDKYFIWIHYERLLNQNKAKHNKTVCIFVGIYCKRKLNTLYPAGNMVCNQLRIASWQIMLEFETYGVSNCLTNNMHCNQIHIIAII